MVNILSDIRQPIAEAWKQYERLMEQSLRADNKLQQEVLRYVGARRGKQLRPLLVLLSAQLCNPVTDKTLRSAVALELLHTASLVHDDVVDSSDTRRGAAAVHVKWNNKVAVLIGDYMLAKVIGSKSLSKRPHNSSRLAQKQEQSQPAVHRVNALRYATTDDS